MEAVNALLRKQANRSSDESGGGDGDDGGDEEEDEWAGFDDSPDSNPVPIDREDEYIDEDRYTTVTIESIDVTKSGLRRSVPAEAGSEEGGSAPGDAQGEGTVDRKEEDGKRRLAKEKLSLKPKVKKKKFRYLGKDDRKAARMKERAGNKAKAKARRA